MRAAHFLTVGVLLFSACERSGPLKEPRLLPFEEAEEPPEPPTPSSTAASFAVVIARALEVRDSITLISYLDTSVTWKEFTAVLATIKAAKGRTDSVRVGRSQTTFKRENGRSSLTWKIFLHGYHEGGTTEQTVVVHHKAGRPWIVGYHVDK